MSDNILAASTAGYDSPCWQDRVDPEGALLADEQPADDTTWGVWSDDDYDRDGER